MTSLVPGHPPKFRQVQRRRLSDEVASTLRDMILVGELMPDRRITQEELASQLGVSVTPVREALLRLTAEGFVRVSPNRSFSVISSTSEDTRDVYWMHAVLSAELTRRACLRADDELIALIRRHRDEYAQAVHAGDVAAMDRANWGLHRAINLAADAPRILATLATTLRFIPRGFYGLDPAWGASSLPGHDRILDALEKRDAEAAALAADAHVRESGETLTRLFADKGHWRRPDESPAKLAPPQMNTAPQRDA
jgi:DNA-binding GntR family transcriptional regulator